MAVRPIVVWPDSRLREPTKAIAEITDEVRSLYRDLVDTMYAYEGVGIAAIQIGVPLKMFLVDARVAGQAEGTDPLAFINPEVVGLSGSRQRMDEGCLSFPGIYVPIERPGHAHLRAMGLDGKIFEAEGDELYGRCMQHEFDHLSGKLMVDFVGPLKKRMIKKRLEKAAADDHVHDDNCHHDHA